MTDISMPGMDGIAAIAEIHSRHPEVRLLVLSMYDTVDFVKRAVASGACGYLMKDAPPFELEQAVRSVMATGSYFSPAIAQRLLQPSEPTADDELTHIPAVRPTAPVVDSNGAGDAFACGFLFGLLAGEPPQRCGLYGAVAGAHACTVPSTTADPVTRDALLSRVAELDSAA